jgi:hypothetical protein
MRYLLIFALVISALAQTPTQSQPPRRSDWHVVSTAPHAHGWAYRHRKMLAVIGGGAIGIVVGFKVGYRKGCPNTVDGIPYAGTPPCPTECYSLGNCEWGTRSHK